MHETQHPHGHAHSHDHAHGGFASIEQATALMTYMLDHNRHHTDELHEVCHKLEDMGKTAAAEQLGKALNAYFTGNDFLAAALEALREAE